MSGVLLTGSSGLIGRRVRPHLERAGWDVVGVSRSPDRAAARADLADAGQTRAVVSDTGPDVVVHLAGGPARSPDALHVANVVTTVNLLEAVAASSPGAYVMVAGSAAEYGEGDGRPLTEDTPCRPVTAYGRAKLAQTVAALRIARAHGLHVTVVRPFNVVAYDMPPSTPLGSMRAQLLAQRGRDRTVVCGRTDLKRDFIPVHEVAAVIAALCRQRPAASLLNICSGTGVALDDVVRRLQEDLAVRIAVEHHPDLLALPGARVVVGDPGRLSRLGHRLDGSVAAVCRALLHDRRRGPRVPPDAVGGEPPVRGRDGRGGGRSG